MTKEEEGGGGRGVGGGGVTWLTSVAGGLAVPAVCVRSL